jgi:hypothetical protein
MGCNDRYDYCGKCLKDLVNGYNGYLCTHCGGQAKRAEDWFPRYCGKCQKSHKAGECTKG